MFVMLQKVGIGLALAGSSLALGATGYVSPETNGADHQHVEQPDDVQARAAPADRPDAGRPDVHCVVLHVLLSVVARQTPRDSAAAVCAAAGQKRPDKGNAAASRAAAIFHAFHSLRLGMNALCAIEIEVGSAVCRHAANRHVDETDRPSFNHTFVTSFCQLNSIAHLQFKPYG